MVDKDVVCVDHRSPLVVEQFTAEHVLSHEEAEHNADFVPQVTGVLLESVVLVEQLSRLNSVDSFFN